MDINPIVLSIPIFFGLILLELFIDWVTGKRSYRLGDAYGNITCGIFEQTTGVLVKVFTVGLYVWAYQYRIFEIENSWLYLILLFIGVDFLYYWAHRMSHESNLLWLGHVVHHQSEDYNLSVALRQGAIQKLFTSPFYLPLAFIGFDPEAFVYILAWNTLYQFWIHTEKIGRMGPLEYILNTPSHHRVHHGRNPKYIDKNHAATLIIWDRMFGTFQAEEERPTYGITKPVNSFNPIIAHWKPFSDLASEMKGLTFNEKMKLLVFAPGWYPKRLGGKQYAPSVEGVKKFNRPLSKSQNVRVLIFFGLILGMVSAFLFTLEGMPDNQLYLGIAAICISVFSIGYKASNAKSSFLWDVLMTASLSAWWYISEFPIIAATTLIISAVLLTWEHLSGPNN